MRLNLVPLVQDIVFDIAKELNVINIEFFQKCSLNEFRLNCWEPKNENESHTRLSKQIDIINKARVFIINTVCSYPTPQMQAQAINLFTLVARECLHQGSADFIALYTIVLALESNEVKGLKDALPFVNKNILQIRDALCKLMNYEGNFKFYRKFKEKDQRSLPLLELIFKDKIFIYEKGFYDNICFLGSMHKSLILIKKKVHETPLNHQSDFLEELYHPKNHNEENKIDADIKSHLKRKPEYPRKAFILSRESSSRSEHTSSKEPSPRSEHTSSKEPSPRNKHSLIKRNRFSLLKEPSPPIREASLYSQNSEGLLLFRQETSGPQQEEDDAFLSKNSFK